MAWDVIFYATAEGSVPGADFLDGCPAKIRGTILAVLDAVAAAPPPAFSGGGKWEAMLRHTQETIDSLNDSSVRAKYRMPYSMPYNVLDAQD